MDPMHFETFDDVLSQCEVRSACSPASRAQVFSLRYRVYCEERKWLAGHGEEERDVHDETAHQVLVTHKATGHPIATARLIPRLPGASRLLPFEEATGQDLDGLGVGEVSRFAVSRETARTPEAAQAIRALLIRGLVKASWEEAGVGGWVMLVRPTFAELLRRDGVILLPHGPAVEHHGLRVPMQRFLVTLLDDLRDHNPRMFAAVAGDLCAL